MSRKPVKKICLRCKHLQNKKKSMFCVGTGIRGKRCFCNCIFVPIEKARGIEKGQ